MQSVAHPPCSILNRLVQVVKGFSKLPFSRELFSIFRVDASSSSHLAHISVSVKVISTAGPWHRLTRHFSWVASESTLKGSLRSNEIRGLTRALPLTSRLLLIPFIFAGVLQCLTKVLRACVCSKSLNQCAGPLKCDRKQSINKIMQRAHILCEWVLMWHVMRWLKLTTDKHRRPIKLWKWSHMQHISFSSPANNIYM